MDIKTALTGPLMRLDAPRPPAQDVAAAPEAAPAAAGTGDFSEFSQAAMAIDGIAELPPLPWEEGQPQPAGESEKPAQGDPEAAADGPPNAGLAYQVPPGQQDDGHGDMSEEDRLTQAFLQSLNTSTPNPAAAFYASETDPLDKRLESDEAGDVAMAAPPPPAGPTAGQQIAANCLVPEATQQMLPHMCVGAMAAQALMESSPAQYKALVQALVDGKPYVLNGKTLQVDQATADRLSGMQRAGASDVVSDAEWAGLLVQTALMKAGDASFDPTAKESNLNAEEASAVMKLVAPNATCLTSPNDILPAGGSAAFGSNYSEQDKALKAAEMRLPATGYVITIEKGQAHIVKYQRNAEGNAMCTFSDRSGGAKSGTLSGALMTLNFFSTSNVGTDNTANATQTEQRPKRPR